MYTFTDLCQNQQWQYPSLLTVSVPTTMCRVARVVSGVLFLERPGFTVVATSIVETRSNRIVKSVEQTKREGKWVRTLVRHLTHQWLYSPGHDLRDPLTRMLRGPQWLSLGKPLQLLTQVSVMVTTLKFSQDFWRSHHKNGDEAFGSSRVWVRPNTRRSVPWSRVVLCDISCDRDPWQSVQGRVTPGSCRTVG